MKQLAADRIANEEEGHLSIGDLLGTSINKRNGGVYILRKIAGHFSDDSAVYISTKW
jgi:hypothetical protein